MATSFQSINQARCCGSRLRRFSAGAYQHAPTARADGGACASDSASSAPVVCASPAAIVAASNSAPVVRASDSSFKPRGCGYLEDGRVWCALEYVDGWTLGDWKERTFPTFREIARVAAQIAGAIEYMHAHPVKVRHRDLKLSNVMIRRSNGEPVIIDLGAATYENAEELTTTPLPPGTDRYRSLEAWAFYREQGHKPGARYSFKVTDELFAMGVMLYELLTAPLPVKNPPRLDCAERVSRLLPAREVNPRVPEAFSALVEDLLEHRIV